MRLSILASLLWMVTLGCGAAQTVLKGQLVDRCQHAGLRACPELADGAVTYIGGDSAGGEAKLQAAAAKNSPEQMKQFAAAVEPLVGAADADTAKSLRRVLAILTTKPLVPDPEQSGYEAFVAAQQRAPAAKAASSNAGARAEAAPEIEVQSGMTMPAYDESASICSTSPADATCRRVHVLEGPFVVTNVFASGGCADQLFVYAASTTAAKAHWKLLAPPNERLNVAGEFIVDAGEGLYAGVRAAAMPWKNDERCTIVWSGRKAAGSSADPALGIR